MPTLQIFTLGSLTITIDGEPLTTLNNRKAQALLVYLACHRGQQHSRDHLQTLLWSDMPALKARNSLRQTLYKLQKALPDNLLLRHNLRVGINPVTDYWLDLEHVQGDDTLYRGEFLHGFSLRDAALWDEWLAAQREAVNANLIEQWAQSAEAHANSHNDPTAIRYWQRVIELNPWREYPHRRLIQLFLRINDRAAAVAQYETIATLLRDELGVEPAAETVALYERAISAELAQSNLPAPQTQTPFVGRSTEIELITATLRQPHTRLLTVQGLGGSGKTRLAIECARQLQGHFLDGTFLVDLANGNGAQIATTVALTLGLRIAGHTTPSEQLIDHLRALQLLLILDNFETVIDTPAAIGLVQSLLRAAPDVTLLVTSRERLRLRLEQVFPLDGLDVASDAHRLFVQAARQASLRFEGEREPIAQICQLVEGMPLALEMAAAWTPELSCQTIAQEIVRDLALMRASYRDVPARQRSLHVVFEATWRRLPAVEQNALMRLSVFRGVFHLAAAQAVAGVTQSILAKAVDKALLYRVDQAHYRLHSQLQQFLAEKLELTEGGLASAEHAHRSYYASYIAAVLDRLNTAEQLAVSAEIAQSIDNIQLAWWRLLEAHDADRLDRCVESLSLYFKVRGSHVVARQLFAESYARITDWQHPVVNHIRLALASTHVDLTEYHPALQLFEIGLPIARDAQDLPALAFGLNNLAVAHANLGNLAAAEKEFHEVMILCRQMDDPFREAAMLNNLGLVTKLQGKQADAQAWYQQSVVSHRALGDQHGLGIALNNYATMLFENDEAVAAQSMYLESLVLRRAATDVNGMIQVLNNLGTIATLHGQFDLAVEHLDEALALSQENAAYQPFHASTLRHYARLARRRGNPAQAIAFAEQCLGKINQLGERYDIHAAAFMEMACGEFALTGKINWAWLNNSFEQALRSQAMDVIQDVLLLFATTFAGVLPVQTRQVLVWLVEQPSGTTLFQRRAREQLARISAESFPPSDIAVVSAETLIRSLISRNLYFNP